MGPLAVCMAKAPMICLTRFSNSIDWLHHNSKGRRGVEPGLLLERDNGGEGKVLKMIVSLLGLCVEISGLNHIIIRKRSGAGPFFILLQQDMTWRLCHVSWSNMLPLLD